MNPGMTPSDHGNPSHFRFHSHHAGAADKPAKKSVQICFRLTERHQELLQTVAAEHQCSVSGALSIILAAISGGPRPPIMVAGVTTPALLPMLEIEAPELFADLDRLVPRLSDPLPLSGDATLTALVVGWRQEFKDLHPKVEEFGRRVATLRDLLLGGYVLEPSRLFAGAEQWTALLLSTLEKQSAKLKDSVAGNPDDPGRPGIERQFKQLVGMVEVWRLLHRSCIVKSSPPVVAMEETAELRGLNSSLDLSSDPVSKHGRCNASCDAWTKTAQQSARITPAEDRQVRSIRRAHRCPSYADALRLVFDKFAASPSAIRIETRVASATDLLRCRRLMEGLVDRFDAIQSRLAAPMLGYSDQQLRKQVEDWAQLVDRLRPRIVTALMAVRCVRNVLIAIEKSDIARLQAPIAIWIAGMPRYFEAMRQREQRFSRSPEGLSDRHADAQRVANTILMWELCYWTGLTREEPRRVAVTRP